MAGMVAPLWAGLAMRVTLPDRASMSGGSAGEASGGGAGGAGGVTAGLPLTAVGCQSCG